MLDAPFSRRRHAHDHHHHQHNNNNNNVRQQSSTSTSTGSRVGWGGQMGAFRCNCFIAFGIDCNAMPPRSRGRRARRVLPAGTDIPNLETRHAATACSQAPTHQLRETLHQKHVATPLMYRRDAPCLRSRHGTWLDHQTVMLRARRSQWGAENPWVHHAGPACSRPGRQLRYRATINSI
jgi:hypothetical protein